MFWLASGKWSWLPFYLLLVELLAWKYRKKAFLMVGLIALLILLSDQLASGLLKPLVQRLRPSHEPGLREMLHLVNGYTGGTYGFVSSHALNVFALSFYLPRIAAHRLKWLPYILFPWAIFVSYSRIYLGAHYPSDVLVPVLLSFPLALFVSRLYFGLLPMLYRPNSNSGQNN